jgi:DNA polymerase III subunit gamma/tau
MSSQTFYLKYRPQKISELDNLQVAEKLSAYLKTGKVPHAFLLVGHKGTGKTSSARLIAKAINCERNVFAQGKNEERLNDGTVELLEGTREKKQKFESSKVRQFNGSSYEPCNECEICKLITEGNDPDVLEIDAASNTSVEDIRDLRDKVRFSASISRYKVYIIDEVHMISKSAFNALLKTLEEPPEKTVFILATTELQKVPDTIVSRCTLIEFKRADDVSVDRSIERIVKGEKLKITKDAKQAIIDISSGSFRDAAKILEQAVYLSDGKEITREVVEKISGGKSGEKVFELLEAIVEKNSKEAIQLIEDLKDESVDLRSFVKNVLEVLHEILLVQVGITNYELRITNLAKKISQDKLKVIIEKLEKAYQEMKFADVMELPVEIAILEILKGEQLNDRTIELSGSKNLQQFNSSIVQSSDSKVKVMDQDFWKQLIGRVNTESKQLAGIMRSCKLNQKNENEFEIEAVSKFHLDRLNDGKAKEMIMKYAFEIIGNNVKIRAILIEK